MEPWWTEKSERVGHSARNRRAQEARNKNQKDSFRDKPKMKSFDETILFDRTSWIDSTLYSKASSLSCGGCSAFSGFDSDIGSETAEKKAYPLPIPQMTMNSSTSSCSSFSSSFDDNELADHEDFSSFRLIEQIDFSLCSASTCPGSKTIAAQALPPSPSTLSNIGIKHENRRHPCHPLPLPPGFPVKSSQSFQSNWRKGKLLGRGTFGHVYVAFNSENGQICAVKEVRVISDDQNSTECLKQLNQEIVLLSELSHPNIVQYYGSKMAEDKLSVYLEYVSGGSVQKLLKEYGPFTEPVIRSYTKQILCGLAYLHRRNTVHRDIKGANILVDPNGEIKLADFGMAKHIKSVSSILSFKGSPYWMAPEVITNTSSSCYSLAVDIWSLGCTVLEMATSKPPWSNYEGVAAIFKIANGRDYPEIPHFLSEDAKNFVKLCLRRDPPDRPTAAQLLHHPFIQDQFIREIGNAYSVDEAISPYSRHP